jgi:hypothetical protein
MAKYGFQATPCIVYVVVNRNYDGDDWGSLFLSCFERGFVGAP